MARRCSTICLPGSEDDYPRIVESPTDFRHGIDQTFQAAPELFPSDFQHGYTLKDRRWSKRLQLRVRRVRLNATKEVFSVRPSHAMPYMTARTDEVEEPLFLRACGAPFWASARAFGQNPMYGYRLELALGRNRIVGTTLRKAELPERVLADEHHQPRDGVKNDIATAVGDGRGLGAALAQTAGVEDLKAAYGVFKQGAPNVRSDYPPKTVTTDGRASTRQARASPFATVVILRCVVPGGLAIRGRGK